jgi:hypothetical protein
LKRRARRGLQVKSQLTTPALITYPDEEQVQILSTDASTQDLGAWAPPFLIHLMSSKRKRVIAYCYSLSETSGREMPPTHLEALRAGWPVHHFRHYLAGRRFVLYTDHAGWQYIFNNPKPTSKLVRWTASLMGYNYTVIYRKGADNPADALSRLVNIVSFSSVMSQTSGRA